MLKILNSGRSIDGLPREIVLRDAESPRDVVQALDGWQESCEALREPQAALRAAEKEAQETTLLVRGERERYATEIREKTKAEAADLRAAERECKREAEALVRVLGDRADEVRAVAARLALVAHADAVDAMMDVQEAQGRFQVAPNVGTHPGVDPVLAARRQAGNLQAGPFEALDGVHVAGLIKAAGCDPVGFVEVVERRGFRLLTTERRAAALVGAGRNGWTYTEEEA